MSCSCAASGGLAVCWRPVQRPMLKSWRRHTTLMNFTQGQHWILRKLLLRRQRAFCQPTEIAGLAAAFDVGGRLARAGGGNRTHGEALGGKPLHGKQTNDVPECAVVKVWPPPAGQEQPPAKK